jgi:expansin
MSLLACGGSDARSPPGIHGGESSLGQASASPGTSVEAGASGAATSATTSGAGTGMALEAGADFGTSYSGQYNLGPVDWQESQWHNACAPYPSSVQAEEGSLLAGLNTQHIDGGRLCDACVRIQATNGKSVIARVVTYGSTGPNDIDVSVDVCTALAGTADCNVFPRNMTWQFAECPDSGAIQYQFQTQASIWWTSFWVRNERIALAKVEVKSQNHAIWTALSWGTDGTLTDAGGFGTGPFTIRLTATDGQQVTDTFPSFNAGDLLTSSGQFQ